MLSLRDFPFFLPVEIAGPVVTVGHVEHTEATPIGQVRTVTALGQTREALSRGNWRIVEEHLG